MQAMQGENQQLKSGAAEKMQVAQVDAQVKSQAAEMDAQIKMQGAQTDAAITLQVAEIKSRADVEAKIQSKLIEVAGEIMTAQLLQIGRAHV